MSRSIEFSINANGIALLRVNRPAARNALTWGAQEAVSYTHLDVYKRQVLPTFFDGEGQRG